MSASGYVHVEVERIVKETAMAFLCRIAGQEHWIPKSQVADPDDYEEGDVGATLSVTEFIAREKGLT